MDKIKDNSPQLHAKLKNRHIQMIAIGGIIGTGLFFGSAKSIEMTGPSIILAYILSGTIIYFIMRALGEMTVHYPTPGSLGEYARLYLGEYAGFITSWTNWFQNIVVCMVELTAVTYFLDYWHFGLPHWITCILILILFLIINTLSVRLFGEVEFWFAGIKVVAIVAMLLFSSYLIFLNHETHLSVITNISSYISEGNGIFSHGYKGFLFAIVVAIFSFGGLEFLSIAAGEAENPTKTIPKAINSIVIRIVLFYVLTLTAVIALYPASQLNSAVSPFVEVFNKVRINGAANIMNFVAITAALSAFNSLLYSTSRVLFNMSGKGFAPKYLHYSNARGIPLKSLLFNGICVLLTIFVNYLYPEKAFMYLLTVATCAIIISWFSILLSQLSFRRQISLDKISYKQILHPYSTYIAMLFLGLSLVVMTQMSDMQNAVIVAPIWLIGLTIAYKIFFKKSCSK